MAGSLRPSYLFEFSFYVFLCFDVSMRVMNRWRAVLSSFHFCKNLAMTSSALFSSVSRPSSATISINGCMHLPSVTI